MAVLSLLLTPNSRAADGAPTWYYFSKYTNDPPTAAATINMANPPYSIPTDGTTDVFSIVTNAIANASAGVLTKLQFPAGTFIIRSTVQLGDAGSGQAATYLNKNVIISGVGEATYFKFENASGPAFYLRTSSVLGFGTPLTISSGATQGSTTLTLAATTGLAVGDYVKVGQNNTPAENWGYAGATSDDNQTVCAIVTNINANVIQIDVPLPEALANSPYVKEFNSSIGRCGFENFSITMTNKNTGSEVCLISLVRSTNCWITGVKGSNFHNKGFTVSECKDTVIENNDIGDASNNASSVYAIHVMSSSTRTRVVNNIVRKASSGILVQDGATYTFVGYNYHPDTWPKDWNGNIDFLGGGINLHGFAPQFTLIEGNIAGCVFIDDVWGMNRATTIFRNWLTRKDPSLAVPDTIAFGIKAAEIQFTNRLTWIAMNILGSPDEAGSGKATGVPTGWNAAGNANDTTATNSTNLRLVNNWLWENSTLVSWNNDTYTTPPASLYYDSKPAWYPENLNWPPFDPQSSSKTNWLPATYRYFNVAYPIPTQPGTPAQYRDYPMRSLAFPAWWQDVPEYALPK